MKKCRAPFLIFALLPFLSVPSLSAQETTEDTVRKMQITSLFVLPIVYFTPETRWAGGVGSLVAFRFKGDSVGTRPSQVQLGFAYTQERQFLSYLPFSIFAKQEQWYIYGELGYYRYTYFFYGLGNKNTNPDGELYDVNFPRLRIHAMRKIKPRWYLGLHYWWDIFEIANADPNGKLSDPVENIQGRNGGVISTPGLITLFDGRDDVFAPESGYYLEALTQISRPWTGSPFSYSRITIDGRYYLPISRKLKHTLALHAFADLTEGVPPFNALPSLGGPRRLRGLYEGRYRDNHVVLAQAEYRLPLFWRLGMAGFVSVGSVFPSFQEISTRYIRYAGGAGLRIRISKQDRVNLRIDAAFGPGNSGYYLTVGEAF